MYTRLQIALWCAAAVIGVAYNDSEAANTKTPPTKTATASAKPTTTPVAAQPKSTGEPHHYAQVLSELHQAKHLLDHANHTYNGHRAKADHEIGKAIHILHHEHHKKGTTTAKATPHKSESPQASDTQLRQAEKLVHAALHELHKNRHDEKAHHASKVLHEAAHEIELAIHLHHKHHANANQAGALKKAE
jgi:hypothetical protein